MFQVEHWTNPNFCSFHEEHHPENSCSDWKRVTSYVYSHTLDVGNSRQENLEDTNDEEEVAPNEPSSFGHVVNVY